MKATGAFISVFLCVTPAVAILAITIESEEVLALKETDHGPVVIITLDNNGLWMSAHLRRVTLLAT
jgi:hypothetical protein